MLTPRTLSLSRHLGSGAKLLLLRKSVETCKMHALQIRSTVKVGSRPFRVHGKCTTLVLYIIYLALLELFAATPTSALWPLLPAPAPVILRFVPLLYTGAHRILHAVLTMLNKVR